MRGGYGRCEWEVGMGGVTRCEWAVWITGPSEPYDSDADCCRLRRRRALSTGGQQCLLTLGRSTSPPLDQFPLRVCSCPLCIINRL